MLLKPLSNLNITFEKKETTTKKKHSYTQNVNFKMLCKKEWWHFLWCFKQNLNIANKRKLLLWKWRELNANINCLREYSTRIIKINLTIMNEIKKKREHGVKFTQSSLTKNEKKKNLYFWYDFTQRSVSVHIYMNVRSYNQLFVSLWLVLLFTQLYAYAYCFAVLSSIYATVTVVVLVITFVTIVLYILYFKNASYPYAHMATKPKNWKQTKLKITFNQFWGD